MKKSLMLLFIALCFAPASFAQDADKVVLSETETETDQTAAAEASADSSADTEETLLADESAATEPGGPKTMSGMSILGNEETPKSLVIVPWKSSEMGDELSLSDTLDERARPVDKEVFLRELNFYQIRSKEQ